MVAIVFVIFLAAARNVLAQLKTGELASRKTPIGQLTAEGAGFIRRH